MLLFPTLINLLSTLFHITVFKLAVVTNGSVTSVQVEPLSDDVNIAPACPTATNNPKSSE